MAVPEASFGWGVPLTEEHVGWALHPSLRALAEAGSELLDPEPQGATEEYWRHLEVTGTGYVGHPRSGLAVYLKRTLCSTADSTGDYTGSLQVPASAEIELLMRYLDEIGFAGDRRPRLLLTAREV